MDLSKLDASIGRAVCGWLGNGGSAVLETAVLVATGIPQTRLPGLAAGLGLMALERGCSFNPDQSYPPPKVDFLGCKKCTGAMSLGPFDGMGNPLRIPAYLGWPSEGDTREVTKIVYKGPGTWAGSSQKYDIEYISIHGNLQVFPNWECPPNTAYIGTQGCTNCLDTVGAGGPGPLPPVDDTTDDGCEITVNFESWLVDEAGNVKPVVKVVPRASTMATGGIIGGCNFNPIIYVGGGGGDPPWWAPWVDGPDGPGGEPWWYSLIRGAAGGLASAAVGKLLDEIFKETLPATVYRLTGVCETNANGEPIDVAREKVIPQLAVLQGLAARLDALPVLTQGLKDLKQPICAAPLHAPPTGTAISVRFLSTQPSPDSGARLRKDFGYRDQIGKSLEEHARHWVGFEWNSGPWMVCSTGLSWGKPQVWAASPQEGERVLRHAAAIAGVDLDGAAHQFVSREVMANRHRYTFKMRLRHDASGRPWVTTRDGAEGFPMISDHLPATLGSQVDNSP